MNYESCLERLAIATDASRDEIEKALAIEEDRCRVLAKIPTKKADAAERQQIISELRELLKTRKEKVIHTSVSPPTNRPQFSRATASSQANSRIDSLDTKPDLDLHLQKRLSRSSKGYHPDDANAITAPLTSPIKSYEESLRSDWDKLDQSAQTDQADDIEDGFAELPARNTSEIGFEEVAEVNFKAVVENEEIVDPGKIGEIRRAVNLWASSVPHHEYITLGNSIEIKQASRHPLFLLNIKTLTEKRRLIDRVSGYKNERLASNRIEPEAIDIWSFAVPEKLNFEYEKIEYEVARARQKFGCTKCETKGEMWCEKCQSTGLLLCRECNGQKQKGCYTCGGTGYKDGQLNVSCRTCLGKGAITCASCRDGWQQCSSCFGSRQISCDKCGGSGQLLKSYFIEVEYKPEDSSFTIFPKDFIESSKKNFIAKKYQSEVKEVVRIEGGSNFDFETLEAVDNQQVRVEILSFANSFKKRMARHLIEAAFCQTTRLLYSFEQTDYEMWLVGEKPRIYCLTSPVHDYDQKLARQAAQLLKAEDFEAVIHKLETAFKHTPNSSSSLVVLNDLLKKLEAGNSPDRTKKVAELGQQLLGPNIGIGFVSIQQKAVAKIRSEFTIVLSLSAFLSLAATLLLLYINAEVYALSITLFVAIPGLLIALGISLLPIAPKIEVRFFRILSAVVASILIVLVASLTGSLLQQEYIVRQKREALARFGNGDYNSAKSATEPLEDAIAASPKDFELNFLLGKAYVRSTQYENAIKVLTTAQNLSGEPKPELLNELGLAYLGRSETGLDASRAKDREKAVDYFTKAIKLSTELYSEAYRNLAKTLQMDFCTGGEITGGVRVTPFLVDKAEEVKKLVAAFTEETGKQGIDEFAQWRSKRDRLSFRPATAAELEAGVKYCNLNKNSLFICAIGADEVKR